ncbi:toll/interleukin-1 receptor domain-containing protein [Prosthecobacter dejongeii]|uniref:toll/interleukin-1 receptor domain-containing protein n=1 Tax=Prosthecobacter dejongeii TaxID=48465 RepID=UPI001C841677|nr:toll/interleukin-1 receptor domain-containing protein [Prosthecobacter dejongeii]
MTEAHWNSLLTAITTKQVIPVVGEGVVTIPKSLGGGVLNPWLSRTLQRSLSLEVAPDLTLNQVVCNHLMNHGNRQPLYNQVKQLLDEHAETLRPQQPLLDLASISDFSLYLSTTFDSLLLEALNQVRYGGDPKTSVSVYRPNAHIKDKDTPVLKDQIPQGRTMLSHLLGRASTKPDYALWDEDILEFILGLHRDLNTDYMGNLAYDLQDNHLLFIGLRYSDWLTRFLVRVTEQKQLSETQQNSRFLATNPDWVESSMVIFFDSLRQETKIWQVDPAAFVSELRERWEKRTGVTPKAAAMHQSASLPGKVMPLNSIFLSYAREDFDVVKHLKEQLEFYGCEEVWFDMDRLQVGENWRSALEQEVRCRCAVFVSCISRTTVGRAGELHRERFWAADTAPIFGDGATFYVPLIIDDLPIKEVRREPTALFNEKHAIRLSDDPGVFESLAKRLHEIQHQNRRQ